MPLIFTSNGRSTRGVVQVMREPGREADFLAIDAWGGFEGFRSIVQKVGVSPSANAQFQHMLGDHIYVYVFGHRMGALEISGISFYDNCSGNNEHGIARVIGFYERNNVVERATPLQITLANKVFEGYLVALRGETVEPALQLFQFMLTFGLVPNASPGEVNRGKGQQEGQAKETSQLQGEPSPGIQILQGLLPSAMAGM